MMRNAVKRTLTTMLAILMAAALIPAMAPKGSGSAQAAEEEYTYTVRVLAGAQGGGGVVYEKDDCKYGERVTLDISGVTVSDPDKYYVRGVFRSGRDYQEEGMARLNFQVTEDADFVVSYGIKGSTVSYTVNYVDQNGNTLAPSETYYGNVGDRPVVAHLYIDGYQPQAYNLTGTLREGAANNFTFVYTQTTQQVTETTTTTTVIDQGTTTTGGAGNTGAGGTGTGAAGTGAAGGAGGAAGGVAGGGTAGAGGATTQGDLGTGTQEPAELVDIEDGEVPLADFPSGDEEEESEEPEGE